MDEPLTAAIARCQQFAIRHKVIFEDRGEVGFGRPCVGVLRNSYIDLNPYSRDGELSEIWPRDDRLSPPAHVRDAYHKHECLAVLVHDDDYSAAIIQLAAWIDHLETQGILVLVEYETGATGMQALLSGATSYAMRFQD